MATKKKGAKKKAGKKAGKRKAGMIKGPKKHGGNVTNDPPP